MPYEINVDLPPSVRRSLPKHAQDIYREAFNHAFASHSGARLSVPMSRSERTGLSAPPAAERGVVSHDRSRVTKVAVAFLF